VKADEVDHIVPVSAGGDVFDLSNVQALCKSHHSQKTRREVNARRTQ
jgi:5-methylcytosine-specific restriction endonuclease McrA